MPVYHFDLEQRSDEWREIRKGRFTGTDAALLLVAGTKRADGLGVGVEQAMFLKCAQLIADFDDYQFETYATRIGNEREAEAVAAYGERIFPKAVTACGFVELGDYFGFSPDGLVGKDGLIEIKCPQPPEYLRYITTGEISKDYLMQMQWGMWITDRKWCDHVVFNPDFGGYPIQVQRIERDEKLMCVFLRKAIAIEAAMSELLFTYEMMSK